MGTCQNICKQQENDKECTMMTRNKINKGQESDRESKTDPYLSLQLLIKEDSIAEENNCYVSQKQPCFIKTKEIASIPTHTDRKNRFENDIKLEIRYKIQQIRQQEEEELRKLQEQQLLEMKQKEEQNQKEQALDNQFSFQNSMKQSQSEVPNNQQTSNPYLPRQTSQFAPKKPDADTVSQKSQISKTPTQKDQQISPKSDMMKKSALKKIIVQREELQSNNASYGTQKSVYSKKVKQLEAFEKMFSDYYSQEERSQSGSHKTQKSVKSILKKNRSLSQRSISMSKNSIKSSHTVFKNRNSKKVRFSNDTNFNNERKGVVRIRKSWWDW
ncbi:unnamed protein product (macronuclear) [Paramecium tetraurelia]|uniref:Uncharacterized protein n=1 Tax=Paramecium tetraurelia TaxID=5888 RepID=A0DZG9_PARTE|nr:uncharacterized protein GSPATT00021603001 [Paramecium tetraurelia]CAK88436.1 unnamed protein product [Paramecium tetraurelia]|eukprot:XP_001455833.1 hypothetical protein (macronuclear) [Paramecium tetraurelia strain d4-2]